MMRIITKEDIRLTDELAKWLVYPMDGEIYLREDAPEEVKKYHEKLRTEYSTFG